MDFDHVCNFKTDLRRILCSLDLTGPAPGAMADVCEDENDSEISAED